MRTYRGDDLPTVQGMRKAHKVRKFRTRDTHDHKRLTRNK